METESPWRSNEERGKRLSPPRGAIPHVSTMGMRRPEPVYIEEADHRPDTVDVATRFTGRCNEYMKQGWI